MTKYRSRSPISGLAEREFTMRQVTATVGAIALAVAACDADSSGPSARNMLRQEAAQLARQLVAAGDVATSSSRTTASLVAPPISFSETNQSTHACPAGGTVRISYQLNGLLDVAIQRVTFDIAGTQVHAGCVINADGVTITIDGAPSLDFASSAIITNGHAAPSSQGIDGIINYRISDGRSGTCEVSLDAVTDLAAKRRTITGTACGHEINESVTW
jgi:hypothetical protein